MLGLLTVRGLRKLADPVSLELQIRMRRVLCVWSWGGGGRRMSVVSLTVVSSSRRKGVFFEINAPRAAYQQENR